MQVSFDLIFVYVKLQLLYRSNENFCVCRNKNLYVCQTETFMFVKLLSGHSISKRVFSIFLIF